MRIGLLMAGICLWLVGMSTSGRAIGEERQPTNIAAQELASALQLLAKERGVQVVYRSELTADHWTSGVTGNLTFEEALVELLDETGLTYRFLADKAITIVPSPSGNDTSPLGATAGRGKSRSR